MSLLVFWPSGAPAAFVMAASANIAAGATTATTAQLTPPATKSTADHQTYVISDDTNPLPAINLGQGKYAEPEWCIKAVGSQVSNGQVYEFRIVKASTNAVLDMYSQTPTVTITTGGGGGQAVPVKMFAYRQRRMV